jgi:hypothetical protein
MVPRGRRRPGRVGCQRPGFSFFRYLATRDKHRDHHCYVAVVFLIQNTQNRDAKAPHLKLGELIRSRGPAWNDMIDIEKLPDEELDEIEKRYAAICEGKKTGKKSLV